MVREVEPPGGRIGGGGVKREKAVEGGRGWGAREISTRLSLRRRKDNSRVCPTGTAPNARAGGLTESPEGSVVEETARSKEVDCRGQEEEEEEEEEEEGGGSGFPSPYSMEGVRQNKGMDHFSCTEVGND